MIVLKGKMNIVIGAQAGSESKGKLAAFLAHKFKPEIITMASCPNSGHTAIFEGKKYVTYHLPVSWVGNRDAQVLLGPTSVIHLDTLLREIKEVGITREHLFIHPRAVMIRDHYMQQEREGGLLKIGSTNTGVGVARREKLMRVEDITFASNVMELFPFMADTVSMVSGAMHLGRTVLAEMTQGFDLCLEHGIDPHYCTSKMIVPAMAMAEAGVSPKFLGHVYGVLRPYPIRVNNREGSSGPYAEAEEITWDEVQRRSGSPLPILELTTTTKLPRRVFEFSHQRFGAFIQTCRPDFLCLQFANYIHWSNFGETNFDHLSPETFDFLFLLRIYARVAYVGTSPGAMIDLHLDEDEYYERGAVQANAPFSGSIPKGGGKIPSQG